VTACAFVPDIRAPIGVPDSCRSFSSSPHYAGGYQYALNLDPLGEKQSIIDIDAKIPDRVLDLTVSQQNLNRAQIAGGLVDHRGFGPPK
jgi:hypothetical protein